MKKFLLSVAAASLALCANAGVFLAGGFNGWSTEATEMELNDGVYTVTVETLTSEFKIVEDGKWYGSNDKLTLGEALELHEGNDYGNVMFADADLKAVNNAVVTYNADTKMLTVTGEAGEAEITYALHGNFFSGEWESIDMEYEEYFGEWVWTVFFTSSLSDASGEFGIKELTAGNQTGWYSCPKDADYVTITGDGANDLLCTTSDNTNFKIENLFGGDSWKFIFNAETHMLSVIPYIGGGIEDVKAADNAPAVYYNLSGMQVANPANGLFIKKQGNVVTKVLVK